MSYTDKVHTDEQEFEIVGVQDDRALQLQYKDLAERAQRYAYDYIHTQVRERLYCCLLTLVDCREIYSCRRNRFPFVRR